MSLLSCEYRNTKWHAALSCCFLFFICIVTPRCCCYLRKTSQVRQRYLTAWQIFEWLATRLRRSPATFWNQRSLYLNRRMSHRCPFPHISVVGTLSLFTQASNLACPGSILVYQLLTLQRETCRQKHRSTSTIKPAPSKWHAEWPDKENMTLSSGFVRISGQTHTRSLSLSR